MKNQYKALFAVLLAGLSNGAAAYGGTLAGTVSGGKGVSVVYVETIPGKSFPAPTDKIVIDQRGLVFQPHVAAVQAGSTVEFLNSDKVAHNIFWPSVGANKKLAHNMGTWPSGQKREFRFETPGVVPLLCNVHPEMSAYVVVSPTPYFVVTDGSGNYKIANLPDGQYNVAVWHEGVKTQVKPVKVAGDTKADFALGK